MFALVFFGYSAKNSKTSQMYTWKKKQKLPIFANFFGKKINKSYTFCMDPK
jgi:hypothetical protein